MDALKDALMKHMGKAKAAAPHGSGGLHEVSLKSAKTGVEIGDHAPELEGEHSPVHPDGGPGHPQPPNAHASGQDEASMEHMKMLEALLGHGGPLASHASAYASGKSGSGAAAALPGQDADKDKQHEKMASIQKHKKQAHGY